MELAQRFAIAADVMSVVVDTPDGLVEIERNPTFPRTFAAMFAYQVMALRTRLERRNIHSAGDRIRHFLAVHVCADHRTVVLPGTLKELAADLGLTHEALYRTLARMEADGEIKRLPGQITLMRRDNLLTDAGAASG